MGWSDFVRPTGFAGWSSLAARQPHKLKVDGSNPSLATNRPQGQRDRRGSVIEAHAPQLLVKRRFDSGPRRPYPPEMAVTAVAGLISRQRSDYGAVACGPSLASPEVTHRTAVRISAERRCRKTEGGLTSLKSVGRGHLSEVPEGGSSGRPDGRTRQVSAERRHEMTTGSRRARRVVVGVMPAERFESSPWSTLPRKNLTIIKLRPPMSGAGKRTSTRKSGKGGKK